MAAGLGSPWAGELRRGRRARSRTGVPGLIERRMDQSHADAKHQKNTVSCKFCSPHERWRHAQTHTALQWQNQDGKPGVLPSCRNFFPGDHSWAASIVTSRSHIGGRARRETYPHQLGLPDENAGCPVKFEIQIKTSNCLGKYVPGIS